MHIIGIYKRLIKGYQNYLELFFCDKEGKQEPSEQSEIGYLNRTLLNADQILISS